MKIKNELGNTYGDFLVTAYTDRREPSNKCVIWRCVCRHCGTEVYRNGNSLRFGHTISCPVCRNNRRK